VKQGLTLGSEAERSTFLDELNVRKPLVLSITQGYEKLRLYTRVKFDNFKLRLESGVFKRISLLKGSFIYG
jgi:hypothetical protein